MSDKIQKLDSDTCAMGHFRVPRTLTFELRPSADLSSKNMFHIHNGVEETLAMKQRLGAIQKWPIRGSQWGGQWRTQEEGPRGLIFRLT